ncbi:hypothetical protein [Enterococcus sp. AZ109]|uniref:hypothetical protein n=1 Tax=Enterococcus sp. AZ109 TaxID=2774634 RepID=UPI003F1F3994
MFQGTRLYYKVLYFITAMAPSYLLFLLQLGKEFGYILTFSFFNCEVKIKIYFVVFSLFVILFLCAFLLKKILMRQYFHSSTDQVLEPDKEYFDSRNVEEKNSGMVTFLLGNILPAVFILGKSALSSILVFISLQLVIYILVMKSSDIFPNVLLVLLKIDLYKTSDTRYFFSFKSKKYEELKIYQLGDVNASKIYITMYDKDGVGKCVS